MKKKFCLLLILILTLICSPVQAKSDNPFFAEDDLTLSKNSNATTFAAGNNVNVTSDIDGASFVAGNNVTISSLQDHIFAAGNNVILENARTKDAFLAGANIKIKSSAIRDLYAIGEEINVESDISRNAYLAGGKVTINSVISGDVSIAAENIVIGKYAMIAGTLKYPEDATIDISSDAVIANQTTYVNKNADIEISPIAIVIDHIMSFLSSLVVGILLLVFCKKSSKIIEEEEKSVSTILTKALIGLGVLIGVPVVAIFALFTMVGLPITIISLLLYGILIYLSSIATAYYLGTFALKDKVKSKYLLFIVSLLAIYLLKLVPVIGGFVSFLSLCIGLGVFISVIVKNCKEK